MKSTEEKVKQLLAPFPEDGIHKVKGPGGAMYDYVKAHYVIQRLVDVFGLEYNATTPFPPMLNVDPVSGEYWITMCVRCGVEVDGKIWEKDGWDSVEVKTFNQGQKKGQWVDLGNNYKQAYSQALKKAVTQLGVALYLYFGGQLPQDEFDTLGEIPAEITSNFEPAPTPPPTAVPAPNWGGGNVATPAPQPTPTPTNDSPPTAQIFPDLQPLPTNNIGTGQGFAQAGTNTVNASVTLEQQPVQQTEELANIFAINGIKYMYEQNKEKGLIKEETVVDFVANVLGAPVNVDQLTDSQAKTITDYLYKINNTVNGE
jgi:hypothetical protein